MTKRDRTGLVLLLLLAAWIAATGLLRQPAETLRLLALLVATTCVFIAVRRWSRTRGRLVGVAVGFTGTVLLVAVAVPGTLSGRAGAPPLGYGNANGALLLLAAGAAMIAGAGARDARVAGRCFALSAVAAAFACLTESRAAAALALLVITCALLARRHRCLRVVAGLALCLPVGISCASVVLAADAGPDSGRTGSIHTRSGLWAQALDLIKAAPLAGAAPGGFARLAPAAEDSDLRWAHSLPLQHAAETGLVGLTLLVLLLGWVCALLWRSGRSWEPPNIALLLLGALLTQASMDYTAHFPVLVLSTALVVGAASGEPAPAE